MALRLGLVGRGQWGRNIERTLLSFADVTVTVIPRGVPADSGLDGVLIATPSASHAEVALPYIESGVPTFIEKPVATSVVDIGRLRDAARRSGAIVFGGHVQLYNPAFAVLLDRLPTLGAVRQVIWESMNARPRTDTSVLWEWLPHHLSTAYRMFGKAPRSAASWCLAGSPARAHAAACHFAFEGASLLSIVSWLSPVVRNQMTLIAERGTLVFDDRAPRKLTLTDVKGAVSHPVYEAELPLTRELRLFLDAIRSGQRDDTHLHLADGVVRAIAAAERSIASGGAAIEV